MADILAWNVLLAFVYFLLRALPEPNGEYQPSENVFSSAFPFMLLTDPRRCGYITSVVLKLMLNDENMIKKVVSMELLLEFFHPQEEFHRVLPAMTAMEVELLLNWEEEWIFHFQG